MSFFSHSYAASIAQLVTETAAALRIGCGTIVTTKLFYSQFESIHSGGKENRITVNLYQWCIFRNYVLRNGIRAWVTSACY